MRVRIGGRDVAITASRDRTLLAMLLLHANHTTTTERLIEAIWATRTRHDARTLLQGCVSRLRKRLAGAGAAGQIISTEPAGYRIAVASDDLDLLEFRRLLAEARTAGQGGEAERAADLYRSALGLWRGPALAGIDSDLVRQAAAALDEEHSQALEERFAVELAAGGGGELVPELTELVQQHPHREGLHRSLMLALYRAGRQADALAAYRHARQLLQDELGTEPGHDLHELHRAILNRDPDLSAPHQPAPATAPVPRELPADVTAFTGRTDALKALDELLPGGSHAAGPVVISAIAGTAGVGKTALAIHWAHQVADQFPDGQLYVNLRGYDPGQPMGPADALARFLSALGLASQDIPLDLDELAARYRSLMASRRMLLVLDNASSAGQIRPLLPGSGLCAVLVTSRDSLAGLVAVQGAHRLDLDLLSHTEAAALLRRLIGPRADAEPDAVAALANQCARLPLALRVAAEMVASRPAMPLVSLVRELSDQQHRLELLDAGGDPHAAVSAVFSWSMLHLSRAAARMFALLGLHPGPHFDSYTAAALGKTGLDQAHRTLEALARAHLIHPAGDGRYSMHDLLRAYATELGSTPYADQARQAPLRQLLDHYRHTTSVAMDVAYPYDRAGRPSVPSAATPTPGFGDAATAARWLDTELPNLLAAACHASEAGWPKHTVDLSIILRRHLRTRGHYREAEVLHSHALTAAHAAESREGQMAALIHLADVHLRQGRHELAVEHYQPALEIARSIGSRAGEIAALTGLGTVRRLNGWFERASEHYDAAWRIACNIGNRTGELEALIGLGATQPHLGFYERSLSFSRRALEIARAIGDPHGELDALRCLAWVHRAQCRYRQAYDCLQAALAIARTFGYRTGELNTLLQLGSLHRRQGDHERAFDHYRRALEIARAIGRRTGLEAALNGIGWVHRRQRRYGQAAAYHRQAYETARTTGDRDGELSALTGLGNVRRLQERFEDAAKLYQQALEVARKIGDRNWAFEALQGLGRLHYATSHLEAALITHDQALDLATDLQQPSDQARAHDGVANARRALNQPEGARQHWQHALDILSSLGAEHTEDEETSTSGIRTHLAALVWPAEIPVSQAG